MPDQNVDELLQLIRELRDGQVEQIKQQSELLDLYRKNQERMDKNFERAERLNSGAASLQEASRKILKYGLAALVVCLLLIFLIKQ